LAVQEIRRISVICIDHFEENDYYNTKKSCRLIKGVVPSVLVSIKYCRMKRKNDRYCYVIITHPKLGNPVTGYNLECSGVYNEQFVGFDSVYNANHEYRRLTLKKKW
jgi:hypothetical protein